MYVYIRSEPGLWTVGFYKPDGEWEPESDHDSPDAAADRVAYLNGAVRVNTTGAELPDSSGKVGPPRGPGKVAP